MTKTIEAYKCQECNSIYSHPSLAEKCENKDRLYNLVKEIGEVKAEKDNVVLKSGGEIPEDKVLHYKLYMRDFIEELENELENELEELKDE